MWLEESFTAVTTKHEPTIMKTVLIVDDEEGFRHIAQVILERAGFETRLASNGEEALGLISEVMPDLILLDDMMPGLSGGDVCAEIKRDPSLAHILVIIHSAGMRVKDPAFIRSIGADAAMAKPTLPRDMVAIITNMLAVGVS
jgi:CheY-like chemotaxis protein